MRFGIRTLDDVEVAGKRVLVRVDVNQDIDRASGRLLDDTRVRACAPTVRELQEKGGRVVLLAHQGGIHNTCNFASTRPHAAALSAVLGREVRFVDDVCGPAARQAVEDLEDGEVLMLDNVRTLTEEVCDLGRGWQGLADTALVRKLAPLFQLYVGDAFASAHREQPSLCGFPQVLPSAMGRLFEAEFCTMSALLESPARPCVFVLGGVKMTDAFRMMDHVLTAGVADAVLTAGLVGQILLWANDEDIGDPARMFIRGESYEGLVDDARDLLTRFGSRIVLPADFGYVRGGERCESLIYALPRDAVVQDIGAGTAGVYREIILGAGAVFANGPMGMFEQPGCDLGTRVVWQALGETGADTILGGLDSIEAARRFGVADKLTFRCTAGGALTRFLTGEELPAVRALRAGSALCL